MSRTSELRSRLSGDHRDVLTEIWRYELDRKLQIPTSALFRQFGKERVTATFDAVGGSVVVEYPGTGTPRCSLTFLGALLANEGETCEALLLQLLEHIRGKLRDDPEFDDINSPLIKSLFDWSDDENTLLYQIFRRSPFSGGGGGGNEWTSSVPYYVRNELPLADDLESYFEANAFNDYDPNLPVYFVARDQYVSGAHAAQIPGDFDFVGDLDLRRLLEQDWYEAKQVYEIEAWKSCVLLCGSILEGVLITLLEQKAALADATYSKIRNRPAPVLTKWELSALVDVTNELRLLPRGTILLTDAIREFRNLVHPGRQLREHLKVTKQQASVAISCVEMCLPN